MTFTQRWHFVQDSVGNLCKYRLIQYYDVLSNMFSVKQINYSMGQAHTKLLN